jgi:hypothetical protein
MRPGMSRRYERFHSRGEPELRVAVVPKPFDVRGESDETSAQAERLTPSRYAIRYGAVIGEIDVAAGIVHAEVPENVYLLDSLLRISLSLYLLERRAVLLHSSGVLHEGRALVCFGPSGAGKTTVARSVPENRVLCDEVMALYAEPDGSVRAVGTPFHGDYGICTPQEGRLAALCRLRQAPTARLTPLSPGRAARELLNSILFFCPERTLSERLLDLAADICIRRTFSLEFALTTHVPDFVFSHLAHDETPPDA